MDKVPMCEAGVVAVLSETFRRRLTLNPLVSTVSISEVEMVDTMPWMVREWPIEMEHRAGFATAA